MIDTILATLTPMATLFLCIAIGFALRKANILSKDSGKMMAKLENWVFCPALSFYTMATFFTLDSIQVHGTNLLFSCLTVGLCVALSIPLSCALVKNKCYERNVYRYALAIANIGYMGDPIVLAMFGAEALAYYKLFCLPFHLVIYTWGITILVPSGERTGNSLKNIINPPMIAMFVGIIFGIAGLTVHIPAFLNNAIVSLKDCMGPVAMLLAGVTIANYNFFGMLKKKKVYIATLLRLIILPIIIMAVVFGIKELVNLIFATGIDNTIMFYVLFATATPLGMNTIVFPEAYGGDPETGASMAMISHTLCVITIPLIYALSTMLFGSFIL
ncbi:MAG: AEC family transporter [Clostridia bacterium]|nr:AEC family transporter [Clostridia bacterium]